MLRIWIVPIIVCFTLGIFAEKAKSDLIPIKKKHYKNLSQKNSMKLLFMNRNFRDRTLQLDLSDKVKLGVGTTRRKTKKESLPLAKTVLSGKETQEVYHKSIVQIKVTFQEPEYHQPWKKKNPRVRRGVGSVVEGNRILIPYSLLPDATLIE